MIEFEIVKLNILKYKTKSKLNLAAIIKYHEILELFCYTDVIKFCMNSKER